MNMFELSNTGFNMKFDNGYMISVRWHESINYVNVRTMGGPYDSMANDSIDAEVAVFDKTGEMIKTPFNENDGVIGWQSPDEVFKIMKWARKQ
jgi:hypothetical protein